METEMATRNKCDHFSFNFCYTFYMCFSCNNYNYHRNLRDTHLHDLNTIDKVTEVPRGSVICSKSVLVVGFIESLCM